MTEHHHPKDQRPLSEEGNEIKQELTSPKVTTKPDKKYELLTPSLSDYLFYTLFCSPLVDNTKTTGTNPNIIHALEILEQAGLADCPLPDIVRPWFQTLGSFTIADQSREFEPFVIPDYANDHDFVDQGCFSQRMSNYLPNFTLWTTLAAFLKQPPAVVANAQRTVAGFVATPDAQNWPATIAGKQILRNFCGILPGFKNLSIPEDMEDYSIITSMPNTHENPFLRLMNFSPDTFIQLTNTYRKIEHVIACVTPSHFGAIGQEAITLLPTLLQAPRTVPGIDIPIADDDLAEQLSLRRSFDSYDYKFSANSNTLNGDLSLSALCPVAADASMFTSLGENDNDLVTPNWYVDSKNYESNVVLHSRLVFNAVPLRN